MPPHALDTGIKVRKKPGPKPKPLSERKFKERPPVQRIERSYSAEKRREVVMWLLHAKIPSPAGYRDTVDGFRKPSLRDASQHWNIPRNTIGAWFKKREKLGFVIAPEPGPVVAAAPAEGSVPPVGAAAAAGTGVSTTESIRYVEDPAREAAEEQTEDPTGRLMTESIAQATAEPMTQFTFTPQPTPQLTTELTTQPTAQFMPQPTTQFIPQLTPQSTAQFTTQFTPQPTTPTVIQAMTEPMMQAGVEPNVQPKS